jgi:nucleoid DNA-binding protein
VELSKYIKEILIHNENVIVSGFGAFEKSLISAKIDPITNEMHPPQMTVIFNPELTVDSGVLIKYIAEKDAVTEDNASELIQNQVAEWNNLLESGQKVTLEGLGNLSRDENGNLQFESLVQPSDFPESYGLPVIPVLEKNSSVSPNVKKEEVKKPVEKKIEPKKQVEKKPPLQKKPVQNLQKSETSGSSKSNKKLIIGLIIGIPVAALIVLGALNFNWVKQKFNSTSSFISSKLKGSEKGNVVNLDTLTRDSVKTNDSDQLETQSIIENYTIVNGDDNSRLEPKVSELASVKKIYIIAGSYKNKSNANSQKNKLAKKGFDAEVLPINNGLYRVSVASFNDIKSAAGDFERIKSIDESLNLWILVKKIE